MSIGVHPLNSHYCHVSADFSQDQYPVCSKILGSSVSQTQCIPDMASVGALTFLDFLIVESPPACLLYYCFLCTLTKDHRTAPLPRCRRPAQTLFRQFDECVLANCVQDGRPLASVTSLLFSQSQAPQLACEKGVCCQGG